MSLNVNVATPKKKKGGFGRVEDGSYPARIVQIIDMGQQEQSDWQTGEPLTYEDSGDPIIKPEVYVNYEFPTERIEIDGVDRPRWTGKTYTLSNHEKAALTALLKAVGVTSGNVADALGKDCMVSVGSTKTGNAKITNVASSMKGMVVGALENPTTAFDFDVPDMDVWEKIPDWMKQKIMNATNFAGSTLANNLTAGDEFVPE